MNLDDNKWEKMIQEWKDLKELYLKRIKHIDEVLEGLEVKQEKKE